MLSPRCSICLLVALALPGAGHAQDKPASDRLAAILGTPVKDWQFSRRGGVKDDYRIVNVAGQPVLAAGPNATILTGPAAITADSEVIVRFRLVPSARSAVWFWLTAGIKKPAENGENVYKLALSMPAGLDQQRLDWSVPPLPGKTAGAYGSCTYRELPASRLTWPALARARVEHDMAAVEPLGQRWLSVRYVLRKNSFQVWLDDRLLRAASGPKLDPFGKLRLTLFDGVQLGSVRIRPLPAEDQRFETVRLDGYVNAGRIAGDGLRREFVPRDGKPLRVGGVPFLVPAAGSNGNDHVDLGPSWLRAGLLEGAFDGWEGDAARWRGALQRDPGRIQFRVRNARYRALHLLAAFEGQPDTTPIVTAVFYRPGAGHPVTFTGRAPLFSAPAKSAVPVQLKGGKRGNLHLVTIPLEPEGLDRFADHDYLEVELTKEVRTYRSFPDPIYYSRHQAGLPSGTHVFGLTLERPAVDVDLQPDRYAHVWTAPHKPGYTVHLRNTTAARQDVELELAATSHDGSEKSSRKHRVSLPANGTSDVHLGLALKRYGYHEVRLRIRDSQGVRTRTRSLAHLHPDTRERGNWKEGRGPIFGFWDWNGGHETMAGVPRLRIMYAAGAESKMSSFYTRPVDEKDLYPDDDTKFARDHHMVTHFLAYQLSMNRQILGVEWDAKKPAQMQKALIAAIKKSPLARRSKINEPELAIFFAEPVLGPVSYMSLPEYYGEPPYRMTEQERKNYENHLAQFVTAASAIKKEWPRAKCLLPWGLPLFPVPFLRHSKEATALMDGPALDVVLFERLPEMQLHQVTLSSQLWQLKQEWLKTGKPWPSFTAIEGPAVSPAAPGALTPDQEADHTIRAFLLLAAYGTTRHLGWPTPSACAGAWGETHYGGGMCDRLPLLSPKPIYSAFATLTRQLNRMNFVKVLPTGSHTTFCLQFRHYKTGELLHVLWTIRGRRPAHVQLARGGTVVVSDSMDNAVAVGEKDGRATFTVTPAPCFVRGLKGDAKVTLGEPDHSDARPAAGAVRLAELGDGRWKQSSEHDADYENSHPEFVRRFPGKMSIRPVAGEGEKGKALAVRLEAQAKQRKVMPFYTTLLPPKPIVIAGKASHLGLWVKASSDWGRVVYCLRDNRGERWLSVGKKGEWNVDDVHCWSAFCFDGWRYLRFELPGNAPYDCCREAGTSFWGNYGKGDGIVDLPLTLEKIIVERRTHVIAPTELHAARGDDVLLGALFAEYETEDDKTETAVRRSRLRMPVPAALPGLDNPIAALEKTGAGTATVVTKVTPPDREADGTRCLVHFTPVAGAKSYDVWVSPYADGRGALLLGKGWTAPGQLLTGLRPRTDFYLFVVWQGKDGKPSRPSKGFKVHLEDMHPMK